MKIEKIHFVDLCMLNAENLNSELVKNSENVVADVLKRARILMRVTVEMSADMTDITSYF